MIHSQKSTRSRPMIALTVALVATGILTQASTISAQESMAADTSFIEVNGFGEISMPADRARISFIVETEGENARVAAEKNADLMDAVIRELRGGAFPGLEIETFGYNLYPRYVRPRQNEPQRIEGYTATNNIRVTTDDMDAVGEAIDRAVSAGANRVSSLAFDVKDPESARMEALARAVTHARTQATVIATALDSTLGAPIEVRGGAQAPQPMYRRFDTAMALEAAPTPIEPGQTTVTANVTIRFRLITN